MRLENINITIIQLWYFINVVETGSLASAARYLNVTHSTLSKSIQSLENNIDVQLFVRDGKNMTVTEAGRFLYVRWKAMLSEMEDDFSKARRYRGGNRRSIRIGTLDSHRSETYLLDHTRRFFEVEPDCELEIERIPTDILRKKLLEHELDVAFTVLYEIECGYWPGCKYKLIQECPHYVCMLPTNPLAERDEVAVQDLEPMNLSVISTLYLPTYNQMLQELFDRAGIHPSVKYHTANANSQVYRLHEKHDIFICDQFHRDFGLDTLVYKPISDTRSGVAMVWSEEGMTKELRAFLSLFP